MAYIIKGTRPVVREARRIAVTQLARATAALKGTCGDPAPLAIHQARRRLKKVRALLRMVAFEPGSLRTTTEELHRIKRSLAPVSDAEAVLSTFDRLRAEHRAELPAEVFATVRRRLAHRLRRAQERTRAARVLADAVRSLRTERRRVSQWRCHRREFGAVAVGLRRTYKRARQAGRAAAAAPTIAAFHLWRRRVKDHWLQLRLISARSGHQLLRQQQQVERLDGVLGRLHDYALLEQAIRVEPLDSRRDTAALLRIVRRCARDSRQQALAFGRHVFATPSRRFLRQVRGAWLETGSPPRNRVVAPWHRAA